MYKLQKAGIGGLFYQIIKEMYINKGTRLAVKVGGYLTPFFQSNIGLRQGDVLSPTLFNLFINDVISCFNKSGDAPKLGDVNMDCLLYADDVVLISQSEKGLQHMVSALEKYCNSWGLTINTDKTKIVVFNKKNILFDTNVKFGQQKILSVDSYKYLGILFPKNGNLSISKTDLVNRGQKAMFKVSSYFKSCTPGFNTSIHLFDHVVKPVMLYAAELWSCDRISRSKSIFNLLMQDTLEKCHLKQLRYSLGVNKKAPKLALYGETGRYPLLVEALVRTVKYYLRLSDLSSEGNELVHNAFLENQHLQSKNSWFNNVKSLLQRVGIPSNSNSIDSSMVIKRVRSYLVSDFIKGWKNELLNDTRNRCHGNKLRTYRTFKTTFGKEHYLSDCTNIKH